MSTNLEKNEGIKIVRYSHKNLFIKIPSGLNVFIGNVISITINFQNKPITFISYVIPYHKNQGVSIPQSIVDKFGIKLGEFISIEEIHKVDSIKRPRDLFTEDGKVDLLLLIPKTTRKGKKVYVDIFKKGNEEWLRVWARGVKIQLELKRYIDPKIFGCLLGQLQAEGAKFQNNKTPYIYFSNSLIKEHVDFINFLRALGISDDLFYVQFKYYSGENSEKVRQTVEIFTERTGIVVSNIISNRKDKGYCFYTYVFATLLGEILLHSMNKIRKMIKRKLDNNFKILAENFVSKLLTGDGTLVISKLMNKSKGKVNFGITLKLSDKDYGFRKDYQEILKNLGINSWDNKIETLFPSPRLLNLLYLLKIDAFKGTDNWEKLLKAIDILTKGKTSHGKSLLKLMRISKNMNTFTIKDLVLNLNYTYNNARQWTWKMNKLGYLVKNDKQYQLSPKGLEIVCLLNKWYREFSSLNLQ